MDDIESLIREAARKVLPSLTPEQLCERLARRGKGVLRRPPRAWCLAVRASDTRIDPWDAAIVPEDAVDATDREHPGRLLPHTVVVDARLLWRLCRPVAVGYGTTICELAKRVGVRPAGLHYRRCKGAVRTHYVPSARGHKFGNVQPIFWSDDELDPGAQLFSRPDRAWSWTAGVRRDRIPDGFEQTVTRVPVYQLRTRHFEEHVHPEHPVNDPMKRGTSVRLPRPPPDYVWYKWKGDQYVGYDWRSPAARAGHMRRERASEVARASRREAYRRKRGLRSTAGGSLVFWGWAWVCPGCRRLTKNLYFPLARVNLIDAQLLRSILRRARKPSPCSLPEGEGWDEEEEPWPATLACGRCHHVCYLSRAERNGWNQLIAYLSGGLLYGREVKRPEGFAARKRAFRSPCDRAAPRRGQVLRRILNGWTVWRIARDLMMTREAVWQHLGDLYRQEGVKDRHELAKKLGSPHRQPLNQEERARERRGRVMEMLVGGRSYREIMAALSLDLVTVKRDARAIYRKHGVDGSGKRGRRRLAERLGRRLAARAVGRTGE